MANVKISDLSAAAVLTGSELFEVVQSGVSVKATLAQVRASTIQQNITVQAVAGGFTATFTGLEDVLVLTAGGGVSGGTINFPTTPLQGQTIHVTANANMTSLTFAAPGGATIYGAPTSVTPTSPCSFVYDGTTTSWYRLV